MSENEALSAGMKALLGYDPSEVVQEKLDRFEQDVEELVKDLDTALESESATRQMIRALCISNCLLAHQIAVLAERPGGDLMWPTGQIYNGLRDIARKVADAEEGS